MKAIIPIDLYRTDVALVVNATTRQALRWLRRYEMSHKEARELARVLNPSDYNGITYQHRNGAVLVYIPRYDATPLSIATLVHELQHATTYILNKVGISYNVHTEEAYTYLLGYLTEEALKALSTCEACLPP